MALFLTGPINFHSFSRDITGLYTVNCYKESKSYNLLVRLTNRERFLQQIANSASVEAVTLAETIVTQINTMQNTLLTFMNGA